MYDEKLNLHTTLLSVVYEVVCIANKVVFGLTVVSTAITDVLTILVVSIVEGKVKAIVLIIIFPSPAMKRNS